MAFDNNLICFDTYVLKEINLNEVYKIMSFRDKMYLIIFRHQCIWIYFPIIYTENILAPYFVI